MKRHGVSGSFGKGCRLLFCGMGIALVTVGHAAEPADSPPAAATPAPGQAVPSPIPIPGDALSPDRLVLAATYGHDKVVRYMLERGMDVNAKDMFGTTALIAAATAGQGEVVDILLKAGADVQASTNVGHTALMGAVTKGDISIAKRLLTASAGVNAKNNRGETALFPAVQYGNIRLVEMLLAAGADPNVANTLALSASDSGYTPLMYAARHGLMSADGPWHDITNALLAKGADPNLRDAHGGTALSLAERNQYADIAHTLRQAGARKESVYTSLNLDDALIKASRNGDTDKVVQLFDEGARANVKNRAGVTPLLEAALAGHTSVVKVLVEHGAKVNTVPDGLRDWAISSSSIPMADQEVVQAASRGDTALIIAVRNARTETVRYLLDHGADINRPNHRNETALFVAAELGRGDITRLMLGKGADANAVEQENRTSSFTVAMSTIGRNTVLVKAAQSGHADVVRILLDAGARLDVRGFMGKTALFWAVERGHAAAAQALLERKADPNIKDVSGLTPLMVAAANGSSRVAELLLKNKADVNAAEGADSGVGGSVFGVSGTTALMFAARAGHTEVVQMLLKVGADVNAMNSNGSNALKEAETNGYAKIVELLKAAGA